MSEFERERKKFIQIRRSIFNETKNNGLGEKSFLYLLMYLQHLVTGFQYFYSGNYCWTKQKKLTIQELVKVQPDNAKKN